MNNKKETPTPNRTKLELKRASEVGHAPGATGTPNRTKLELKRSGSKDPSSPNITPNRTKLELKRTANMLKWRNLQGLPIAPSWN